MQTTDLRSAGRSPSSTRVVGGQHGFSWKAGGAKWLQNTNVVDDHWL